jgi:hypothetical protein
MESRLKNLRDLLGAYTELIVIFPFNHKDVEAILSYDQEYFEKCWRFGIPDLQQWVSILQPGAVNKERKIIGFDMLEPELLKKLLP